MVAVEGKIILLEAQRSRSSLITIIEEKIFILSKVTVRNKTMSCNLKLLLK